MAEEMSAIRTVLNIIGETPNAYLNREGLNGLRDRFGPAIEFLETPWARKCREELDRRFFGASDSVSEDPQKTLPEGG